MSDHRLKVEASKRDAYRSRYSDINRVTFLEAWRLVANLDSGLSKEAPEDAPEGLKRAIVGLARRVSELEKEWC